MIDMKYRGRLGNRLIQYAAAYVLAKKTGLQLDTPKTTNKTHCKNKMHGIITKM